MFRDQLHEYLYHFAPTRTLHSFCCADLSFLHVLASKVMHSLREITATIHSFRVEHMLTSVARHYEDCVCVSRTP